MTRIILHGCNGHMGKMISSTALEESGICIAAGVDIDTAVNFGYPVYSSMKEAGAVSADVVVDFSVAKAVDEVIEFAAETGIPSVICTTGLSEAQLKRIEEVSGTTAILRSANMALGVNLLLKLAADAAKILSAKGYDIEIVRAEAGNIHTVSEERTATPRGTRPRSASPPCAAAPSRAITT